MQANQPCVVAISLSLSLAYQYLFSTMVALSEENDNNIMLFLLIFICYTSKVRPVVIVVISEPNITLHSSSCINDGTISSSVIFLLYEKFLHCLSNPYSWLHNEWRSITSSYFKSHSVKNIVVSRYFIQPNLISLFRLFPCVSSCRTDTATLSTWPLNIVPSLFKPWYGN